MEYAPTVVTWACPYSPGGYRVVFGEYSDSAGCSPGTTQQAAAGATSLSTTLAAGTTYCVTVMSLNDDGSDGHWSQVKFQTKAAPPPAAQCLTLDGSAVTVEWPPSFATLTGGTIQISWVEENPSIEQYQVAVWRHGGSTLENVWTSPPLSSASLQYGSTDTRLYTVPISLPGSASTGLLYGVVIWARTDTSCKTWSSVGVVDPLVLNW
jgi:hypothetical protein